MTDPNTTPGDEQTATLLVDRTSSTCGGCGQPTLPSALTHANVSGYDPKPGGGCGARFVAIRSTNRAVTEEHLRSMRPDLPVDTGREQQMTDRPYTDDDLRAEAARLHARAARDTDDKIYQAVQRRWGSQLDVDQLDETGDALLEVLDRAADTSRWAVDLGADQLQPGTRAIDIGWNNGPLMARIHIAYAANMPDDEREQLVTDLSNAIAGTVPVR